MTINILLSSDVYPYIIKKFKFLENDSASTENEQRDFFSALSVALSTGHDDTFKMYDGIRFIRHMTAYSRSSSIKNGSYYEVRLGSHSGIDLMSEIFVPFNIQSMELQLNGTMVETYYFSHQCKNKNVKETLGGWIPLSIFYDSLPIFLLPYHEIKFIIKTREIVPVGDSFPVALKFVTLTEKASKMLLDSPLELFFETTTYKLLKNSGEKKDLDLLP